MKVLLTGCNGFIAKNIIKYFQDWLITGLDFSFRVIFCFRLAQEGALVTIPFLGSRVIRATKKDFEVLLSFSDFDNPPALNLLEQEISLYLDLHTLAHNELEVRHHNVYQLLQSLPSELRLAAVLVLVL
jgi:hypothetical protein